VSFKWVYRDRPDVEAIAALSRELGLDRLAATVCVNRGLTRVEQVRNFLNPSLNQLSHPFTILDLEKAVDRVLDSQMKAEPEFIRVFTDYDVDGTSGAALLTWFFRDLKFRFDVTQPDRFKDGYGLNVGAVERAHEDGVKILMTVDCGITNFDAAEKARELGIELIIIDHHQIDPVRGLPPALAVVDPQRADDPSGLKQLCGCALAFYLCMGIRIKARDRGFFSANGLAEPNLKSLLDLVVLATAADMVPLVGDNRVLVTHGLEVLRETQKPGLRAMMETAGIEVKKVSPMSLGFTLGPRINASGRMGSAETAYLALTTRDPDEAMRLARELESINQQRATLQNQIWDEVRETVQKKIEAGKFQHAVVVASENWHEGVVGIVASKVTDHFKRPAIVLAVREDGIAKGSVRSYGGYNVLEALHLSKHFLKGYGGHKYAAGLSLSPDDVEAFADHYDAEVAKLESSRSKGELHLEGEILPHEMTPKALEELERLAPFGPGNPEPLFSLVTAVDSQSVLKGRHLKLKLSKTPPIEGIWFNAAERLEYTQLVEKSAQRKNLCVFAGIPELNRFMGRTTPTLRIKDATEAQ